MASPAVPSISAARLESSRSNACSNASPVAGACSPNRFSNASTSFLERSRSRRKSRLRPASETICSRVKPSEKTPLSRNRIARSTPARSSSSTSRCSSSNCSAAVSAFSIPACSSSDRAVPKPDRASCNASLALCAVFSATSSLSVCCCPSPFSPV